MEPRPIGGVQRANIFTIVAVGRLDRYKGFDLLLRQASSLEFDFELEIVGDGSERADLERLADDLGIASKTRFLGHREDVPELLARAHVQVVSSRSEGFSLALVEGLYYSSALISTPVGIAPEVLPTSMIVNPGQLAAKLAELHQNYHEFTRHFAQVKSAYAHRFSRSASVQAYLDLYEEVLGGGYAARR